MKFWTVAKAGGGLGSKVFSLFKVFFLIFFFAIIFAQALIMGIEQRSIEPMIEEIGSRFFTATSELNSRSITIIERDGLIDSDEGFAKNNWNRGKEIYYLLEALFIIFIWIKLIAWFAKYFMIQDDSKTTSSYIVAIVIFFLLQVAFILWLTDFGPDTPFTAFVNFKDAIQIASKGIVNFAERVSSSEVANLTEILNNTNITK